MAEQSALLLVLHDIAPCNWRSYLPFVAAVDALGNIPMSWLVVPDFHRRNPLDSDPALLSFLEARLARGDELVLHGYQHCDSGPAPRHPADFLMRRIYTHEGEFYRLSRDQALTRLDAGIAAFERHTWPLHGFVAPAWLMSTGTRQALRERPLSYTSSLRHLYRLPDFTAVSAPGLVWSARSAWRRGSSWMLNRWQETRWRHAQVIRLGLHPVDMHHELASTYWLAALQRLLEQGRVPLTKYAWLNAQTSVSGSRGTSLSAPTSSSCN